MLITLQETFRENENRIAVIDGNSKYTFKELLEKAIDIKEKLNKIEDDFIGIFTDNNFFTYASILGVLFSGKAFVPLNHKFPITRLEKIISSTEIHYALACSNSVSSVKDLSLNAIVSDSENLPSYSAKLSTNSSLDDNAYILFTSGSTGEPKGIPINLRNISALVDNMSTYFNLKKEDKVLQMFELSFDVSIACMFMAFSKAATLVLSPLNNIIAIDAAKTIYDHKVNIVTMPPSAINYLKKYKILGSVDFSYVDKTIFTGEALPLNYLLEWKSAANNSINYNAYGPTENTVWSVWCELNEEDELKSVNGLMPIGNVLNKFDYLLINEQNIEDPSKGELWVSGPQVMTAYWKNPNQTKSAIVQRNEKHWYKSGDIVEQLETGKLMYLNRKDFQVQVNGYRVELSEVEHKIKTTLCIDTAVVIPISEQNEPLWLLAVVEKDNLSKDEIASLRKEIPFYMFPKKIETLSSFPLNSNGKIDKIQIQKQFIK